MPVVIGDTIMHYGQQATAVLLSDHALDIRMSPTAEITHGCINSYICPNRTATKPHSVQNPAQMGQMGQMAVQLAQQYLQAYHARQL